MACSNDFGHDVSTDLLTVQLLGRGCTGAWRSVDSFPSKVIISEVLVDTFSIQVDTFSTQSDDNTELTP